MKFSLRHLFLFVSAAALAIVLSQSSYIFVQILVIVAIGPPCYFIISHEHLNRIFAGGSLGILVTYALVLLLSSILHLPRPPIQSRYDRLNPPEQERFEERVSPYVVPFGFLLGATFCLAWPFKDKKNPTDELVHCQHCGRFLAPTTRTCPRCENRTGEVLKRE